VGRGYLLQVPRPLLDGDMAQRLLTAVVTQPRISALMSDEFPNVARDLETLIREPSQL
jgi:hypothetical protein